MGVIATKTAHTRCTARHARETNAVPPHFEIWNVLRNKGTKRRSNALRPGLGIAPPPPNILELAVGVGFDFASTQAKRNGKQKRKITEDNDYRTAKTASGRPNG
jgi:hypothetical protein